MISVQFDEHVISTFTDDRSFQRGSAYHASGRVRRVTVEGPVITGVVDGTRGYRVRLEVTPDGMDGRCSCPYSAEVGFCKHCVALALAWLDQGGEIEPARPVSSSVDLRGFLLGQDRTWLADQLVRAAETDPLLHARLAVAAGHDPGSVFDDRPWRERLRRAIEIVDFVDHHGAYGYFAQVAEALDAVAGLVDGGFPDAAIALSEHAIELLEEAAELVDDSDGGLRAALSRAQDVHLTACMVGEPDPVALAERLVAMALESELEIFLEALPDYEAVLGHAGVARYRELVDQAWRALPPRRPHDYSSRRFVITHLRERAAEQGGTDEVVAILARTVSSGYDTLRIAERLSAEGRDDEALAWLDRGLTEFEPDARVRAAAAAIHLRARRREQAAELLLSNFVERPTLLDYHALRESVADGFAPWRERALSALRSAGDLRARSVLVEIYLDEDDVEAAWATAIAGNCDDQLLLRLARARAGEHPADAIPVLLRAAERAIAVRQREAYRSAALLLREAGELFTRCGREGDFHEHVIAVRDSHRTKWALRQEFDRVGLP